MKPMQPHYLVPARAFESYAQYLEATGSTAIASARRIGSDGVLAELQRSGLRGRGGAGFPTAIKWTTLQSHWCPKRYVVCNAAEGEPGTFKDRWLIRNNPYATLEGMVVAAAVIGSTELYVALKASFSRESDRLREALDELDHAGLLEGLNVEIVEGPEEYLFGEEKALLNVIDGTGPLPREAHYPPFEVGLFGNAGSPNPALVNNAETYAHVPSILTHGGASFRQMGTADTSGTVIYTVSGDVVRPGVYELEAGIPLRKLFQEVAGGPVRGRSIRAAISGVSSGVITEDQFDTPADFGSLARIGAGLGSAGFMVVDDHTSIPRVLQSLTRFLYVEACGQCTACKHGLGVASTSIDTLFDPHAVSSDLLSRVVRGAKGAPQGNRCYLPVQGSILVPSFVDRFRADLEAQAASTSEPPPPYPIPKIVDYDPQGHHFTFDARQALKLPDWTYESPPVERRTDLERRDQQRRHGSRRTRRTARPVTTTAIAHSFVLPAELVTALEEAAKADGRSTDEVVTEALRRHLGDRG